jgi:hypothetical protein
LRKELAEVFNDSSRLIDQLHRECEFARDDLKRVASALVESEKMIAASKEKVRLTREQNERRIPAQQRFVPD